jgi:magnesium chelatase subunit I
MKLHEQLKSAFEKHELAEIIGQDKVKAQLKSALLANHHIIITGPPGVGKTTLAKNISNILPEIELNDCPWNCSPKNPQCPSCKTKKPKTIKLKGNKRFIRVQGSPDLTVEDLLGDIDPIKALKFGPLSEEAFTPGKIFKANNGILFFDELNRAPEKLQNALLQVLEEGKATISSYDVDFHTNFIFIATLNPKDSSTEKLSDVLLDRFDMAYMSYPDTHQEEKQIITTKGKQLIEFPQQLIDLLVKFVRELRQDKDLDKVPGVRATLAWYERAQTSAILEKREEVTKEDLLNTSYSVLAHRIELKPSLRYVRSPEDILKEKWKTLSKEIMVKPHGGDGL